MLAAVPPAQKLAQRVDFLAIRVNEATLSLSTSASAVPQLRFAPIPLSMQACRMVFRDAAAADGGLLAHGARRHPDSARALAARA
jgi:hypothetical protein